MPVPTLDLSALLQEVTDTTTVEESAIALMDGFAAAVTAANAVSQQAVTDAVAKFATERQKLADAVAANT